jgi:hypothetical protein
MRLSANLDAREQGSTTKCKFQRPMLRPRYFDESDLKIDNANPVLEAFPSCIATFNLYVRISRLSESK